MTFIDKYGRPLEELDMIQLRLAAMDLNATCYSIYSSDGHPMMGFIPHDYKDEPTEFIAFEWKAKE